MQLRPLLALITLLGLSEGLAWAEPEDKPKPTLHSLELPGMQTLKAKKQAQDREEHQRAKVEALAAELPAMTEEEALGFAREWGAQLNLVLRDMVNPEMSSPYRTQSRPDLSKQFEQIEEIVALVSLAASKIVRSEKLEKSVFGLSVVGSAIAGAKIGAIVGSVDGVPESTAGGAVFGACIGAVCGMFKGIGNWTLIEWWKNRSFRKKLQAEFEGALDPEFRSIAKLDFRSDQISVVKNSLKASLCARGLLPASSQKLLGP